MSRRMFVKVTAPTITIGVLLLGACLASAWYITQMQANLTSILTDNVAGLHAAQQLEIHARKLRHHCYVFLLTNDKKVLGEIAADEARFEKWLERARAAAHTASELRHVEQIRQGYRTYREEFGRLQVSVLWRKEPWTPGALARQNPLQPVVEPCQPLLKENEAMMHETAAESQRLSSRLYLAMLLLGVGGPAAGLISGYGIARGLSRSLHQLSVRLQDVSQQLEQDVASVSLKPDGDLHQLDEQVQHIVRRVEEVAQRLHKQQRELLRAQQLSAVGHLAACVAHEIRNPLTAVKMLVEVALRGRGPKQLTADDLRVIHDEVVRLEQTVQNLLNFARLPAPNRAVCDMREVVAQAADLVRARAKQQAVEVVVRSPGAVPAEVDRGQFCNVLVNLFLNALDAMPHGGRLEVELTASPPLAPPERGGMGGLTLRVTDTGSGIPPEMAADLFTPFTSSKPTGTGLGLSISKRIVEEHDGTISASNLARGGACFTITLPGWETRIEDPRGGRHVNLANRR
ncbi:MAG: HAMP domain-containing histidine kinase [Gemmataceae bacterium]|nr:HAMP domain-containing histidine kinase [Gemmataceae bacterium]